MLNGFFCAFSRINSLANIKIIICHPVKQLLKELMDEVEALMKESILDNVLVKSEKKELQELITTKGFGKRELDVLRSEIFKIARDYENKIPFQNLIDWIEKANKLTLTEHAEIHNTSSVFFSPGNECKGAIIHNILKPNRFTVN